DARIADIESLAAQEDSRLPPLWVSLLPILVPVSTITAKAGLDAIEGEFMPGPFLNGIMELVVFFGEKNVALITGALIALLVMVGWKKGDKQAIFGSVQAALMSGGIIILITAAGGAFGGMLQQTGISARIV